MSYTDAELIGAQLAIHPVLSLLALQEDAPEAEAQIRDCAEKIASALAAAGRLLPVNAETWAEHATGNWYRPLRRTHWAGPWLPADPDPVAGRLGDTWASPVTVTGFDTEEDTRG